MRRLSIIAKRVLSKVSGCYTIGANDGQRRERLAIVVDPALVIAEYEAQVRPGYWRSTPKEITQYLRVQLDRLKLGDNGKTVGSWRPLDFDSGVFGLSMGRIDWFAAINLQDVERGRLLQRLLADTDDEKIEQLSLRLSACDVQGIQLAESAGFRMVTVFTGLVYAGDSVVSTRPEVTIRSANLDDLDALRSITDESFTDGTRFHLDDGLASNAQELHRQWIKNCVNGQLADRVIVAEKDGHLVGYITGQADSTAAKFMGQARGAIGLFAVRPMARGRGVGASLLAAIINYFSDKCIKRIEVGTESTNSAAINVYIRAGFKIVQSNVTLHRWQTRQKK